MSDHPGSTVPVETGSAVERELHERLATMPREIGVLLVTIGVLGIALPGIVGTPALIAGGLMLWPRGFRSVNRWLGKRCPKIHGKGIEQLIRYLDDMERRYPTAVTTPSIAHLPENRHERS